MTLMTRNVRMIPTISHPVRYVTVAEAQAGQRLDNFLLRQAREVPKAHWYRLLRRGEVRVNKGRVGADYRVQPGDIVRLPPLYLTPPDTPAVASAHSVAHLEATIAFEDPALVVVNKPSGLAVHGGSGVRLGVIETLRQARPEAKFLELVHRLDRDTSGLLLIAKKPAALRELHELLRQHEALEKAYLVLLAGVWEGGKRQVDLPLRKNILASGERVVRVHPEGKPAQTRFVPLLHLTQPSLPQTTLCRAWPLTGRTHQIRVHAAAIGHPVAGDEKYGDDGQNKLLRQQGLRRLFLHAERLHFKLQTQAYHLHAPLPDELRAILTHLAGATHVRQFQALNL